MENLHNARLAVCDYRHSSHDLAKRLSHARFQFFHASSKVSRVCLTWVGETFDSEIRLLVISQSKCATITKLHTAQIPVWTSNRAGDEAYVNFTIIPIRANCIQLMPNSSLSRNIQLFILTGFLWFSSIPSIYT